MLQLAISRWVTPRVLISETSGTSKVWNIFVSRDMKQEEITGRTDRSHCLSFWKEM